MTTTMPRQLPLLFILTLMLSLPLLTCQAQNMTGEEIISAMEADIDSISDIEARVQGQLQNLEDLDLKIDILVQLIPAAEIARAEFFEPFELADNFILLNEDAVYNYLFLTNQVTILDASDPDAFGSIFPELADSEEELNYDLSLERLFTGWTAEVLSYQAQEVDGSLENTYSVRLDSPGASELYIIFDVVDQTWQPHQVKIFEIADDTQVLQLYFRDFKRDTGLDADEISYIPNDAEVIDER